MSAGRFYKTTQLSSLSKRVSNGEMAVGVIFLYTILVAVIIITVNGKHAII